MADQKEDRPDEEITGPAKNAHNANGAASNDTPEGVYRRGAPLYRAVGWRGVLPLPPAQKFPPLTGFTGHDGAWPSDEQIAGWVENRPTASNLMLRINYGLVGIDVDAYDAKTGGRTLKEAESRWGPLPANYRTSARGDDPVSGQRVFRVPEGVLFRGVIKFPDLGIGDVELIQPHHRFVVAWPSIHPKTGQSYRWYAPDGSLMPEGVVPRVEDLPELPPEWIEALSREALREEVFDGSAPNRTTAQREKINEELYQRLIGLQDDGAPDRVVAARLDRAVEELASGTGGRYDTTRDHVAALVRLAAIGRVGVPGALSQLYSGYVLEVTDTRPQAVAEAEFLRFTDGAAALVAASSPTTPSSAEQQAEGTSTPHLRDRMLKISDLGELPPVEPLIDKLLYRNTLAQLIGPAGCYKSFAAIGMACSVAAGVPFAGTFAVRRAGRVVYVAAEGANGMQARVLAWCEAEGIDPKALEDQLFVLPDPVQLGDPKSVAQAVDVVRELDADLVIVDTRARSTVGLEENNATEQGRAIAAADEIRNAAGCAVLVVHHSGRNGDAGRGSNAWDGAVWTELRMKGQGLQAKMQCFKHKDLPDGCEHQFSLQRHTVSKELMPCTLEIQRQTLVISNSGSGIEDLRANSQLVVLEIVRNSAPPEGFTAKQVVDLAKPLGVGQTSVYNALKALLEDGSLVNLGTTSRTRYAARSSES